MFEEKVSSTLQSIYIDLSMQRELASRMASLAIERNNYDMYSRSKDAFITFNDIIERNMKEYDREQRKYSWFDRFATLQEWPEDQDPFSMVYEGPDLWTVDDTVDVPF